MFIYELSGSGCGHLNRFYINCLFGCVELTKNANTVKYKYSGYRIGFDFCLQLLFTNGRMEKIFGADMSSSVHIDNKNKYIVILDKGPTHRLVDTTLTAEA